MASESSVDRFGKGATFREYLSTLGEFFLLVVITAVVALSAAAVVLPP